MKSRQENLIDYKMEGIYELLLKDCGGKDFKDGSKELNAYLEQGWKVKMISACAMGDVVTSGQAYIVLEKN